MSSFTFQNLQAVSKIVEVKLAGLPMRDDASVRIYHDAINLLAGSLSAARRQDKIPIEGGQRAQFEMIFGYSMLALNEARALWSLVSAGLELQATVHLRTIAEHAARATTLIRDELLAERTYQSLGASERDLLDDLQLEPGVKAAIETTFAPVVEHKPDWKFLPKMRETLKVAALGAFDYGSYRAFSQTVHGSVFALRRLAQAIRDSDDDFIDRACQDGSGEYQFSQATYLILALANALAYISGADIDDEFLRVANANAELLASRYAPKSTAP
ncbi:MAG: hypothetical protein ACYC8W_07680 [Candidatus Tyrphobacter sp.]